MKTDYFVFIITELTLIFLFLFALGIDLINSCKAKSAGCVADVKRGEKSMNALYVNFGVSTVVFTLIVQTCTAMKGNQASFILINYGVLTYLFLFSSWFRNELFFKFVDRVRKD